MVNARPGYWDVDRCAWVGAEPAYVVPVSWSANQGGVPVAPGPADGSDTFEIPIPRDGADSGQVTAESF